MINRLLLLASVAYVCSAAYFKTANQEYSDGYSDLYKWSHIAEPFRKTIFTAMKSKTTSYDSSSKATFKWTIGDDTKEGEEILYAFTSTGYHRVKLEVYSENDELVDYYSDNVMVKYVRREIRTLSDKDRNKFFRAFKMLYTLDETDGRNEYGSNFHNMEYFVKKHIYGAASKMCDHWHDDAGIVVHHMAFTLELEMALQSIDPSVTMPYWSYTYDELLYGTNWENSTIFADDWFSPANPGGDTHIVDKGQWAYTKLPTPEKKIQALTNPYGILRSPWNINPAPYITRNDNLFGHTYSDEFPTCTSFYECIDTGTVHEIFQCLNGQTHGPVHIMIGGQWGNDHSALSKYDLLGITEEHLLLAKDLWRQGYVRCPTTCTDGKITDTDEDCACYVPDEVLALHGAYKIMVLSGIMHFIADDSSNAVYWDAKLGKYSIHGVGEEDVTAAWESILAAYADLGSVGEMYTSASPWDPIFWIIHPESERLLNYKLLTTEKDDFDRSWGYTHKEVPSDSGLVCDWTGVGDAPEMPFCYKQMCPGHAARDIIPFSNFRGQGEVYTNEEFFNYMQPDGDEYPYIYDNYKWKHCVKEGVDLGE